MRQQIAALAALASACMLIAGCTNVVDGKRRGRRKARIGESDADSGQRAGRVDAGLQPDQQRPGRHVDEGAGFRAKGMWDWSKNVADKDCLAVDGAAQDKVYAGTGWTAMRGQRLDDSIDDSKNRKHYAIQAVVAFPNAQDASNFYNSSVQSWKTCANRKFNDVSPNQPDTIWTVGDMHQDNGMLSSSRFRKPATAGPASAR